MALIPERCDPDPVPEGGSLLVLASLAFVLGGASGLVGALFRMALEWSDRSEVRPLTGRTATVWSASRSCSRFRPSSRVWLRVWSGNSRRRRKGAASQMSRPCCATSNPHLRCY